MAKQASSKPCDGLCAGKLEPLPTDKKVKPTDTPDSIMAQIALACDDNTGVFFFRADQTLYMRTVEAD